MNFYTRITSIIKFETVYNMLRSYMPSMKYWRGAKTSLSKVRPQRKSSLNQRKLSPKDALILTLMRLRLGLLNEDLADRFMISNSNCSNTFTTWLRFLSVTLGDNLVQWIPKEYKEAGHGKCRVIIDCSEIFIERSKSFNVQASTWSDYKHHNTVKFLIGISPTGFVSILSDCYGGRASDRFVCEDSRFYDILDPCDEVMADRGFQIKEDLSCSVTALCVFHQVPASSHK